MVARRPLLSRVHRSRTRYADSPALPTTERLEGRTLFAAGELDFTFGGGDGIVSHPDAGRHMGATAAVTLPDGKVVVAGGTSTARTQADFLLARYNADGTLDTTFGHAGRTVTDFAFGNDYVVGVASAPGGKIVVVGTHRTEEGPPELAVARYNADGSLDATFDGDGRSLQRITLNGSEAAGVAVQGDGKIVVAATSWSAASGGPDLGVVRYLPSGALDTSFNGRGFVLINVGGEETAGGITLRADGRIVAAATTLQTTYQGVLVGLNTDGTPDATFGTAAVSRLAGTYFPLGWTRLIALPDNRIVGNFLTEIGGDVGIFRTTASGVLDPTFGTAGRVVFPGLGDYPAPAGLARQADGKFVAAIMPGYEVTQPDFFVARVTADGKLDISFAGDGLAEVTLPEDATVADVVVQPSGRIVTAGTGSVAFWGDVLLAGLTPAGALDPTFRSSNLPADPVGLLGSFSDVLVQGDGKILAVGSSTRQPRQDNTDYDVYLARFLPSGAPDPSFGNNGKVLVDFGSPSEGANRVALQSDGRILVSGRVLARFLPGGTLDTTFGGGDGFVDAGGGFFSGLAVQAGDKILVSDPAQRRVSRYNRDGSLDTTFATGGHFTNFVAAGIEDFRPTDVAVQPTTGRIIVGGNGYPPESNSDWVVIAVTPNGSLDTTFGTGGASAWDSDVDLGGRLAIRPSDGLIAMAGNEDDDDAAFILVGPDGQPRGDNRLPYYPAWTYDVAFDNEGRLVVVTAEEGDYEHEGDDNIRVNRFDVDARGAGTGFYVLDTDVFERSHDTPQAVAVEPDGDVIVAGTADGSPVLLRFQGSGAPDPIQLYSDGSLVISGTEGPDTLSMSLTGNTLSVRINDAARTFSFPDLTEVFADLGGGNDTANVDASTQSVSVYGGAGNDTLTGGDGYQVFFGGDGNDTLLGGDGADRLTGDGGNDSIDGGLGGDHVYGGAGVDTIDYSSRTADLRVTLGDDTPNDGEADERDNIESDVEVVRGGSGNDYLAERTWESAHGNGYEQPRNALYGNAGNDTLDGGTAADALFGGPGDDTLLADEMPEDQFWPGTWVEYFADFYSGGGGNDTIDYSARSRWYDDLSVSLDGIANDGRKAFWDGYGTLPAEGDNVSADVENVIAGAGDDDLVGSSANNRLVGGDGDDMLRGMGGDDVLDGGLGRDWLRGDAGTDTADFSSRTRGLQISLNGRFDDGEGSERDNVFTDVENVWGGSGGDVIVGSSRNNRLEGRGGNDMITGGGGSDRLYGGDGDDTLYANDGITDAVLDGGAGNDRAKKDASDPLQSVEMLL
jgi:uncharacterized delta-60 repeat protein